MRFVMLLLFTILICFFASDIAARNSIKAAGQRSPALRCPTTTRSVSIADPKKRPRDNDSLVNISSTYSPARRHSRVAEGLIEITTRRRSLAYRYQLVMKQKRLDDAQAYCQEKYKASLVVISSKNTEQALKAFLRPLYDRAYKYCLDDNKELYYRTAGHRKYESMTFEWWVANGRKKMRYTNWSKGQPDNYEGHQNCVYMYSDYTWHDAECATRSCFICENRKNRRGGR